MINLKNILNIRDHHLLLMNKSKIIKFDFTRINIEQIIIVTLIKTIDIIPNL